MDAVGADQDIRFVNDFRSGFAVMEAAPDPSANLLERGEGQSATEMIVADAFADSAQQQRLQTSAMDRILRPSITGRQSPGLAADQLSELVVQVQPLRGDAGFGESVAEPELDEFAHGGRLQIDADPERQEIAHRFIDPDVEAGLMQAKRKAQPADAASDNDDFHLLHFAATRG